MEKYKEKLMLSFGSVEICDFPTEPTSFNQFPSGRFIIGDMYDGDLFYYRLNVNASTRNRGRNSSTPKISEELCQVLKSYIANKYGSDKPTYGWTMLSDYLYWLLDPVGRIIKQSPGSKLVPLNGDRGFELYIEFPQLIFFKMEPRVTCRDPKDVTRQMVTFMAHNYEHVKEYITEETVRVNYPRDGFFGKMVFDGRPYFFGLQVANLNRWNHFTRPEDPPAAPLRNLSQSMDEETLGIILHREICKRFSFMRHGDDSYTFRYPNLVQVNLDLNEDLVGYPNIREEA